MKTPVLALALALLSGAPALAAPGFPEPPIVFYGGVTQSADGYTIAVTEGVLTFALTPAVGAPVTLAARLTSDGAGGSFYRLNIPVEKVPAAAGFKLSPDSIAASATSATYGRAGITLNGVPVSIVAPAGPTFAFAEVQRGKREQVNLTLPGPFLDTDGDGLPDWFEDLYGLNKYDPADGLELDPFGRRTYLEDYQRHINPLLGTEYDQWTVAKAISPAIRQPLQDADGDGIPNLLEFALDTNPNQPDEAVNAARRAIAIENIAGANYLVMTVQKPGRQTAGYTVETSGTLQSWSSAEGTAVVTIANTATLLKVRDATPIPAGGAPKRFIRLRVTLNE